MTVTASETLLAKLAMAYPTFGATASRIWHHPDIRRLYVLYLLTMHGLVRAAVPLLREGLDCARARADRDPAAVRLAAYLEHHIPEEVGHDRWVVQDLEALGVSEEEIWSRLPSPQTAALVGAQYYWMRHVDPIAVLGYVTVMECYPPSPELVDLLMERTGWPREAFRSLRRHARLDIRHRADVLALLDELPLTPDQARLIAISGLHTIAMLVDLYQDVLVAAEREPVGAGGPA